MNLESLNEHFVSTAQRTTGCHTTEENELFEMIHNLPDDKHNSFELRQVSTSEIMNTIETIRWDSSTESDCIPINYIKLVGEHIAIPIANHINKCIRDSYFPKAWKIARVSPIPKVNSPTVNDHSCDPYQFYQRSRRFLRKSLLSRWLTMLNITLY